MHNAAAQYPPSIRAMVISSDTLQVGSLHLITYTGTTVGREKNLGHGLIIPDDQVSKVSWIWIKLFIVLLCCALNT